MSKENSKNKVTDWRIIGVSGDTADGRHIRAEDLVQMAESYDPGVYGARINLEHCYFTFPGWAGGYGDVVELKAEPWSKDESRTALLARLSVLPNLQELWDAGEKIYTSMEIASNFAKSGKAYLVGLAITDSPASLGTTANFNTAAASADKGKTFTPYHLTEINESKNMSKTSENSAEKPLTASAAEGIFTRLFAKFAKTEEKPSDDESGRQSVDKPEDKPAATQEAAAAQNGEFAGQMNQAAELMEKFSEKIDSQQQKLDALEAKVAEFEKQLETKVFSGERSPHAGAAEAKQAAGW